MESCSILLGGNHIVTVRERLSYAALLGIVGKGVEAERESREVEVKAKEQLGPFHEITREARFMNGS